MLFVACDVVSGPPIQTSQVVSRLSQDSSVVACCSCRVCDADARSYDMDVEQILVHGQPRRLDIFDNHLPSGCLYYPDVLFHGHCRWLD